MFSGPGTQKADQHSRMELSDPGVQDEIPCSGMIAIQAAVTSQNLGQDPEQECIMGRSPWEDGGGACGPRGHRKEPLDPGPKEELREFSCSCYEPPDSKAEVVT